MPDNGNGKDDDGKILESGGRGGQSEIVKRVEDAHAKRGESSKEEIRKDDAIECGGLRPTAGAVLRRGEGLNDKRGEDDAENGDDRENQGEGPEQAVGESPQVFGRGVPHIGGEDRDKRGCDDAVADEAAEKVGQAVGEDEGIGGEGGTEKKRDALVSDVAENAAGDGDQRDDGSRFEGLSLFGQRRPPRDLKPIKTMS